MKIKRKLTSAQILGPRFRCWRCKGARTIDLTGLGDRVPCPSCHHTDPASGRPRAFESVEAVEAARRAA